METRSWKEATGLIDDGRCGTCNQHSDAVEHLVARCTKLANSEYPTRHTRALMTLAVACAKQQELMDREGIYQQKRNRGKVVKNDKAKLVWDDKAKLVWDFEFHL